MSSDIMAYDAGTDIDELSSVPSDVLKERLVDALANAVSGLREAAQIVRVLEERGEDLSEFRGGLFSYLPRIAYGQVLPEVVVRFAGSAYLMNRVAQLPIPEQKRLGDGGMVDVVVRRGDHFDTRKMSPLSLGHDQLRQVFAGGFLRTVPEQIAHLEADGNPEPTFAPSKPVKVKADARTGTLKVGRHEVPIDDALKAIGGMAPVDSGADSAGGTVAIDGDLYDPLKRIASHKGMSVKQLVRLALLRAYFPDGA